MGESVFHPFATRQAQPYAGSDMERRQVTFQGSVQGVGFRATARTIARGHPVTGWVRNQPDRSVLLEVQGEKSAVDAYLADLRTEMGRLVRAEHAIPSRIDPDEAGFEIRY
ncbi:acylphosphatase [Phycisphaerales bacterium]|nr:acylphosphatase [Phycisphaerales bacterium]